MRLIVIRRLSQAFFLGLFFWFCLVATVGTEWWRLRGWPIDWFLNADPLTALATTLTTHVLHAPMLWALVVIALTILLGRFFCGWVCPMGTLGHFLGWIAWRGQTRIARLAANRYRSAQRIKYYLLAFILAGAALGSLQTGLLDPLPFIHRAVNLALAPVLDAGGPFMTAAPRHYAGAWVIGGLFLLVLGLNVLRPRFYCRYVCPLGAAFGLLNRFSPFRIGKTVATCHNCEICETVCEGACQPAGEIRPAECVLCLNCLEVCPRNRIAFAPRPSAGGEISGAEVSRRGVLLALTAGLSSGPFWRLSGLTASNWNAAVIRPPGALAEEAFLARCIKCGQCLRVCPTNVIQPAAFEAGWEGLWTPLLNFRTGQSGCQLNCIACGQVCPTAAIRPLSLEEKLGRGSFAAAGPLRMGLAAVDRSRCLPWAMDRPCLVCQEICPVSPKAIFTRRVYEPIRDGLATVTGWSGSIIEIQEQERLRFNPSGGDYFARSLGGGPGQLWPVTGFSANRLTIIPSAGTNPPAVGQQIEILVRLERPHVDPALCIGCGICEHDCPVSGLKAIRVTADNESRQRRHVMIVT